MEIEPQYKKEQECFHLPPRPRYSLLSSSVPLSSTESTYADPSVIPSAVVRKLTTAIYKRYLRRIIDIVLYAWLHRQVYAASSAHTANCNTGNGTPLSICLTILNY